MQRGTLLIMKKINIGMLSWHDHDNVGSNLQAYALQNTITNLGYTCEYVNYKTYTLNKNVLKSFVKSCIAGIHPFIKEYFPERYRYESLTFQKKYLRQSQLYTDENIKDANGKYNIFMSGGDQIWAPNVFNPVYMLSFVDDKTPKYSYASSIGLNKIPENLFSQYKFLLSRFDKIGIREEKGKKILDELGLNSTTVLDPTYLVGRETWTRMTELYPGIENVIFCYFLSDNSEMRKCAFEISQKLKCPLVILSKYSEDNVYKHYYLMGPSRFIALIKSAKLVLTDSFHGMSMAIIFRKNFYVFKRFKDTDPLSQNSRVLNILEKFELKDRLVEEKVIEIENIEYEKKEELIQNEINKSKNFLNTCILEGISRSLG